MNYSFLIEDFKQSVNNLVSFVVNNTIMAGIAFLSVLACFLSLSISLHQLEKENGSNRVKMDSIYHLAQENTQEIKTIKINVAELDTHVAKIDTQLKSYDLKLDTQLHSLNVLKKQVLKIHKDELQDRKDIQFFKDSKIETSQPPIKWRWCSRCVGQRQGGGTEIGHRYLWGGWSVLPSSLDHEKYRSRRDYVSGYANDMKLELFSYERYSLFVVVPTLIITNGIFEKCITFSWLFYSVGISVPTKLRLELRELFKK